jgi:hypothetical protein
MNGKIDKYGCLYIERILKYNSAMIKRYGSILSPTRGSSHER